MASFINGITEARKRAGLTQQQLANAVGVSLRTVSRWEKIPQDKIADAKIPLGAIANALAQSISVDPSYLLAVINKGGLSDVLLGSDVHLVRPSESRRVLVPLLSREVTACCGTGIPMYNEVQNPPDKIYSYTITELGGRYDEMRPPVAVYADGACLERARIQDGDILVINPALEPRHLQICVVIWRGSLSAKRVSLNPDGSVDLRSDYDTYHIDAEEAADPDQFVIWGPVVEVRHGLI